MLRGQLLTIVEAIKLEHAVAASADGVVTELLARAGTQAAMEQVLAVAKIS